MIPCEHSAIIKAGISDTSSQTTHISYSVIVRMHLQIILSKCSKIQNISICRIRLFLYLFQWIIDQHQLRICSRGILWITSIDGNNGIGKTIIHFKPKRPFICTDSYRFLRIKTHRMYCHATYIITILEADLNYRSKTVGREARYIYVMSLITKTSVIITDCCNIYICHFYIKTGRQYLASHM